MLKAFMYPSLFAIAVSASPGASLQVGDQFPALAGHTLSGVALELPSAGAGSVQVVLFSFSRAAGSDARVWNEHLARDFGASAEVSRSSVIMLESVPKLFRGTALSGIKSNVPKFLWEKTILLFEGEALWKSRLAFSTDSHGYVVVLDKAGRTAWIGSGPFTDKAYAGLQWAVMGLITGK